MNSDVWVNVCVAIYFLIPIIIFVLGILLIGWCLFCEVFDIRAFPRYQPYEVERKSVLEIRQFQRMAYDVVQKAYEDTRKPKK